MSTSPAPPEPSSEWRAWAAVAARFAWPAAFVAVAALGLGYLRDRKPEAASTVAVEHEGPTIVRDLQALARLETTSLHVEKVIDVTDHQQRLDGLVDAEDSILFVATGEVILGVDLAKREEGDARFDEAKKTAYVTLPQPEILSTRFDEAHSYVHSRSTDLLAKRNEALEGVARREAVSAFEKAARESTAMDRAREQAEKEIRALGKAWGATLVVVRWKQPRGEVGVPAASAAR
jgi:hypothetical protein